MTNKQNSKITAALSIGIVFIILIVIVTIGIFTLPKKQTPSSTNKTAAARTAAVAITASGFVPAVVTVNKGTTITWTNDDSASHQVVANPYPNGKSLPSLRSEVLNNKQSYSFTATKKGSFGYHDQLNPTVNGTMEVTDSKE